VCDLQSGAGIRSFLPRANGLIEEKTKSSEHIKSQFQLKGTFLKRRSFDATI